MIVLGIILLVLGYVLPVPHSDYPRVDSGGRRRGLLDPGQRSAARSPAEESGSEPATCSEVGSQPTHRNATAAPHRAAHT